MINYVWPLALVVLSNVLYHSCAKSVPEELNPLASLTVTYAIGAMVSLVFFYLLNPNADIAAEYRKMNWAPIVLGLAVVGLEVGYIYAYKAGWPISTAQIVQAAVLAVLLLFVGKLFYNEGLTWNKVAGIIACLVGLGLIRA
jgi:drug/metabolite transporter (DMT)-like permease